VFNTAPVQQPEKPVNNGQVPSFDDIFSGSNQLDGFYNQDKPTQAAPMNTF
jgi:hypothetical protein